ncbi:4-hydroxyacetophenone monooxygenase, partial [Lasius niger]
MNQAAIQRHSDAADIIDTLIIGAGFSGLAMAIRLQQRGKHNFLLLERADEVGGAWRDNSYPGIACDVSSHLYSYSFRLNPNWSQTFSPGPEILQYLKDTAREEDIYPHIRFRSEVSDMRWDEATHLWTVRAGEQVYKARVVTLAIGHLADWKLPNLPGIESFTGEILHSAAWKHDLILEGKRIGVVGSGASAIQIVPELAKIARQLVVFQRTPPWVMPRNNTPYTEGEKRLFRRDP